MKLRYDPNEKGNFLSRTGLYSDAAFSLITSMKRVCGFGLNMVSKSVPKVSGAIFFGDHCEVYRDFNGEVVINGSDDKFFFGERQTARVVDCQYLLNMTKAVISRHLPVEEKDNPDFTQIFMKLPLVEIDGYPNEDIIKKKDLFILRDFLLDKSLSSYTKAEVDAFIGKPANALVMELRKDLESRIYDLKSQYQAKRDDLHTKCNMQVKALRDALEVDRENLIKEEDEEIKKLMAETESLILANQ